uniref:Riboflavin kinase n=1 Tax=Strigamia maritima TaxID=126957 RepID=T1IZI2_STRMM
MSDIEFKRLIAVKLTTNEAKSIMSLSLPYFTAGPVIKGFGRGSVELGIPTANFPEHVVDQLPSEFSCGIYFGWANVDDGPVYKMVMSIGWNPFYKNVKKSMETHIIHRFDQDFYGSTLKVAIVGYIRPEMTFNSLEELIAAIKDDVRTAEEALDNLEFAPFRSHSFFAIENHT